MIYFFIEMLNFKKEQKVQIYSIVTIYEKRILLHRVIEMMLKYNFII
jgi:hypothetical protein